MSERDQVCLEHGDIKLFLMPKEVALVVGCMTWWQTDLTVADAEFKKLDTPVVAPIRSGIPDGVFRAFLPVVESTIKTILVHSAAHFDERNDTKGNAGLQEKLSQMDRWITSVQRYRSLVSLGINLKAVSQQQKKD